MSGAHDIVTAFADRFGDVIPKVRGDYTEYWTDALGTDARRVGEVRTAKERLVDAQVLSTLLKPDHPATLVGTDDAWRDVLLTSEHTWGYYAPSAPFAKRVEAVKAGFFDDAADRSRALQAAALRQIERPDGDAVTVLNTLSFPRTGVVTIRSAAPGIIDEAGHDVPAQRVGNGDIAFLATNVPALGCKTYRMSPRPPVAPAGPCVASGNALRNGLVELTVDPATGDIDHLGFNGHEFVERNSPYRLNSYRYLHAGDPAANATGPTEVTVSVDEAGPLVASLLITSQAPTRWTRSPPPPRRVSTSRSHSTCPAARPAWTSPGASWCPRPSRSPVPTATGSRSSAGSTSPTTTTASPGPARRCRWSSSATSPPTSWAWAATPSSG
jgi:hypothetical protein